MTRTFLFLLLVFLPATNVCAETLEDAWQISNQVSHRLRAQQHQVEASREEWREARAARMPVVSHRTAYIALSEQPSFSIGLSDVLPIPLSFDVPLSDREFALSSTTMTMPLYMGGKIRHGIDARNHLVRANQASYATSRQELRLEVTESYFNVLRARQLHQVMEDAEKTLFRHMEDTKKLLEQKIVTRNASLAAQAAWANAAQGTLKAENQVIVAEAAYNRYMGRPLDFPVFIDEMPVPPESGDLDYLTNQAFRYRKELAQVASQSRASASASKAAAADLYPHVVAMGGHAYMQNSHMNEESLWSAGVGLSWTPLDGGASRARQRAAMQNAAAAARMRDETRSLIELEVRAAWTTERETRSRISVAELGKTQADENFRVVTRQFQEGLVNHTEVLDAQTQQTVASMNLCNATYDAITATYRLKRAIGLLY